MYVCTYVRMETILRLRLNDLMVFYTQRDSLDYDYDYRKGSFTTGISRGLAQLYM